LQTLAEMRKVANLVSLHELGNRRAQTVVELEALRSILAGLREEKCPAGREGNISEINNDVMEARLEVERSYRCGRKLFTVCSRFTPISACG
jgi:hypothetical protein